MLFDSEWPCAVAAPVWVTDDREDETPPCLDDGSWSPTGIRPDHSREDSERCDLAKSIHRRKWIAPLNSILGELRSRMHRRREIRRNRAAWTMVDDRLLKDIGTSRIEVEYARAARHWG